ncbi:MAG: YicC family protein [Magnetococcales bacterium]|nr:YicC family protein [Magnetococcales bacterium]
MTGFARLGTQWRETSIVWTLRSVNHRYFECQMRLPDGMGDLEIQARNLLKKRFERGHVECVLNLTGAEGEGGGLELDSTLLRSLLTMERRLGRAAGRHPRDRLSLAQLMTWPGLIRARQTGRLTSLTDGPLGQAILVALDETARSLQSSREREGRELAGVVRELLATLTGLVGQVAQRLPQLRQDLERRLRDRLAELAVLVVDESRISQEIAFNINRMDVAEELDRLQVHIREMAGVLDQAGPVGRRLDFLCQELNREANTLCSKSQDVTLSRLGVELKVTVEKLREQVQNLQ